MGIRRMSLTDALEGNLSHGSACGVHRGLAPRGMVDDGAGGAIRDQSENGAQVGESLSGRPGQGPGGSIASPAGAWAPDRGGGGAGDRGAAPSASAQRAQETAGDVGGADPGGAVAGAEHDWRAVAPRRVE